MSSAPAASVLSKMQIDLNMACLKLKDLPANSTHEEIYKKLGVEGKYMTKLREYFDPGNLFEEGFDQVSDLTKILLEDEQPTLTIQALGENVKTRKIMILFVLGVLKTDGMSFEKWMTYSSKSIRAYIDEMWEYIHSRIAFSVADVYQTEITSAQSEIYDELLKIEKKIPMECFMSKLHSPVLAEPINSKACVLDNISSEDQCFKYDPEVWYAFFMWCSRDKTKLTSYAIHCQDKYFIFLVNVPKISTVLPELSDKNSALFKMIKDPYTLFVCELTRMNLIGQDNVHIVSRTGGESCYPLLVCVHMLTLVFLGKKSEFFADTDFFDGTKEMLGCLCNKKASEVLVNLQFNKALSQPLYFDLTMTEEQIEAVALTYLQKMKSSKFVYDSKQINDDKEYQCTFGQKEDHLDFILGTCQIQYNWLFKDARLTSNKNWELKLHEKIKITPRMVMNFHEIGVYRRILHLMRDTIDKDSSFYVDVDCFFTEPPLGSTIIHERDENFYQNHKHGTITFNFMHNGIEKKLFNATNSRFEEDVLMKRFSTIKIGLNQPHSDVIYQSLKTYFRTDAFTMFDIQYKFVIFTEQNQYIVRDVAQISYNQIRVPQLNFLKIKECPDCGLKLADQSSESWYNHMKSHADLDLQILMTDVRSESDSDWDVPTPVRDPPILRAGHTPSASNAGSSRGGSVDTSRASSSAGGSAVNVSGGNFGGATSEAQDVMKEFLEILARLKAHHESSTQFIKKAAQNVGGSGAGTQEQLDLLQKELDKIKIEEQKLLKIITEKDQKISELMQQAADQSNKLTETLKSLDEIKLELQTTKTELQTKNDTLREAETKITELEAAALLSKQELEAKQTELTKKEEELKQKEDEHKLLIEERDDTIRAKDEQLKETNEKLTEKETELNKAKAQLTQAQTDWNTEKADLERQIQELQDENAKAALSSTSPAPVDDTAAKALQAELDRVNNLLKISETERNALQKKLDTEEAQIHTLMVQIKEMNDLLKQELHTSTDRTSTAIDGLHNTTNVILQQYIKHAKLDALFADAIKKDATADQKKAFYDKATAGITNKKKYSAMALFLMYESMAATWFLYKKKIQEPRIQTAYRNQEDNVTQEDKDFVLEKFMYELRQWKTIDQPSKQLYHSKHFKEFVDFWGLAVT
jgi:hypothetical protein